MVIWRQAEQRVMLGLMLIVLHLACCVDVCVCCAVCAVYAGGSSSDVQPEAHRQTFSAPDAAAGATAAAHSHLSALCLRCVRKLMPQNL